MDSDIDPIIKNYLISENFMKEPEIDVLLCAFLYSKINPKGDIGQLIYSIIEEYKKIENISPAIIKSIEISISNGYNITSILSMIPHKYVTHYLYNLS